MMPQNQIQKSLFALFLGSMLLTGCGVHNPFCGSARPKPVLTSLAPNPASLAQIQQGLLLTVNGSNFYSSSIIVWNGAVLPTTVVGSTELRLPASPRLPYTLLPTSPETSDATAAVTARH